MPDPLVYAIVINWNRCEDTLACLASLEASSYAPLTILVVDNGSTDGSPQRIRAEFPKIELLALPENTGYAGGNNAAFRHLADAGADYFFLLNNDATAEEDCIGMLVAAAESAPDIGIVGAKVLHADDPLIIESAGVSVNLRTGRVRQIGYGEKDAGQYAELRRRDAVNGAAMLVRASLLKEIGCFDEDYFCYFEEVDFCLRAGEKDYRTLYCPDAMAYHKGASSGGGRRSPMQFYYGMRNQLLLAKKRGKETPGFVRTMMVLALNIVSALLKPGKGRLGALKWLRRGWQDYRKGAFGKANYDFSRHG
jgi:hypothetical protein